jgi:hypothetical protein
MPATLAALVVMTVAFSPAPARALRTIPDDNLAYPVLVTLSNGAQASGFFVNGASAIYLITARHLLFGGDGENLLAPRIRLRPRPEGYLQDSHRRRAYRSVPKGAAYG